VPIVDLKARYSGWGFSFSTTFLLFKKSGWSKGIPSKRTPKECIVPTLSLGIL
jgi:hypothetical protein